MAEFVLCFVPNAKNGDEKAFVDALLAECVSVHECIFQNPPSTGERWFHVRSGKDKADDDRLVEKLIREWGVTRITAWQCCYDDHWKLLKCSDMPDNPDVVKKVNDALAATSIVNDVVAAERIPLAATSIIDDLMAAKSVSNNNANETERYWVKERTFCRWLLQHTLRLTNGMPEWATNIVTIDKCGHASKRYNVTASHEH